MTNPDLVILTNIRRIYNDKAVLSHLSESFTKILMPDNTRELKKIFNERTFILSVIDIDKSMSSRLFTGFTDLVNISLFPVLIIGEKGSIKKIHHLFPVTTDYLIKPAMSFEFHMRISRLMEIYKAVKKLEAYKGLEEEIELRGNILEFSRQELIEGTETVKALDTALELSRKEMIEKKEELMALEQILEYSRKDKMDLMNHIKLMENIINLSSGEKKDYEKEIDALENLLLHIIREKKGISKRND